MGLVIMIDLKKHQAVFDGMIKTDKFVGVDRYDHQINT